MHGALRAPCGTVRRAGGGRRRGRGGAGVGFMAPSFQQLDPTFTGLKWQADLADQLPGLIARRAGRTR